MNLTVNYNEEDAMMKILHKAHPGQFGMKNLAENNCWPHKSRQYDFDGINCSECTEMGKNLKSIISNAQISKFTFFLKLTKNVF